MFYYLYQKVCRHLITNIFDILVGFYILFLYKIQDGLCSICLYN